MPLTVVPLVPALIQSRRELGGGLGAVEAGEEPQHFTQGGAS